MLSYPLGPGLDRRSGQPILSAAVRCHTYEAATTAILGRLSVASDAIVIVEAIIKI